MDVKHNKLMFQQMTNKGIRGIFKGVDNGSGTSKMKFFLFKSLKI